MSSTSSDVKNWVETWQQANQALNEIKRLELRRFEYSRHRSIIDGLLQMAFINRVPRPGSGLVDQQEWFKKLHSGGPDESTI